MKRPQLFSFLYFAAVLLYGVFETMNPAWLLTFFSKAVPVCLLLLWLFAERRTLHPRMHWLMAAGLFFALGGDLLLQWNNRQQGFFVFGLGSFLLTQVFYSIAFLSGGGLFRRLKSVWSVLILLPVYGFLLVSYLKPGLGELFIPVTVYASVIVLMCIGAFSRLPGNTNRASLMVLAGAILFLASDSMIAISRFGTAFPHSRILIIITYFLAQYLILYGMLRSKK